MAVETVKLTRSENTPWGFRLSGGKDFGVVLTVQKVNPGSLADKAGMREGDAVTAINGQDTGPLRHKEAQDAIIRGGNCLEISLQKGVSSSWKPGPGKSKTGQRASAAGESVTAIVHSQYNSPAAMYSMNAIAETLSAHAEMIAPGVMGINFMKPEKPINTMSEVYKLVQEEEQMKGDRTPSPDPSQKKPPHFRSLKASQAKSPTPPSSTPPVRQVRISAPPVKTPPPVAPKPVLKPVAPPAPLPSAAPAAPGGVTPPQATCSDCGRYIAGIFVRLGDRTLHEECFRCSTCGTSLKNMGYVNINNKLYCEIHAKLAAKIIPPEDVSPTPPVVNAAPPAPAFTPAPPPPAPAPAPPQVPPPLPMPPAAAVPKVTQSAPSPFSPQVQQNLGTLGNLPMSPSSSGGLPFRSISPQPFRRAAGDYHKVSAPMSPPSTGSSTFAPSFTQSGPLPFEMTPYMPPEPAQSVFSTSSSSSQQITQVSQTSEQTTQITQKTQSSQFSVNYKQVIAQQSGRTGTKFVWPPPKPDEAPVLESNATPMPPTYRPPPNTQHINYSPLAMQSTPSTIAQSTHSTIAQSTHSTIAQSPSFRSIQPLVPAPPAPSAAPPAPAPLPFVPPPLPSSFIKPAGPEPPKQEPPKSEPQATEAAPEQKEVPKPEPPPPQSAPAPISAPLGPSAPGFAPVLPPVVEPSTEPKPSAPQSGVPTGAGSRPAPKRGRGQLKEQTPGRIPICSVCGTPIRGPFVTALGKTWCPNHFHCNNLHCKAPLQDIGFVEEQGQLYCENCYEAFLAPICNKCTSRIKGDCLNALDKQWHPECFICAYCSKPFGNTSFYLEDGLPYCEKDWNELFTTKCVGCGYAIEAGDRWVEALNNNYHSQCFKCSICNKNLEGQSFYAKGGRPFCKAHAR